VSDSFLFVEGSSALRAAVCAGLALLLYLPCLGSVDITGDDEARDIGVVRDMVGRGEWLVPQFNSAFRYELERPSDARQRDQLLPVYNSEALQTKPPLFYWAAGVSAMLQHGAVDEWSARLPAALFAAATAALTVTCGAQMVGIAPAFLGGLMLATMPMFHGWARLARCDTLLVLLVACFLFVYHLAADPMPRGSRLALGALLGLSVLDKGLAGAGLVATVIALDAFAGGRKARLQVLLDPAAVAVFVLMVGGWLALAASQWGTAFVFRHFVARNFSYFLPDTLSGSGAPRGWLHHLSHFVNIFTNTAPWGLFLPAALIAFWRRPPLERSPHLRFLVLWLTGGLVYFTVAARKSPYYLLPLYPAVALIVAELLGKPTVAALERGALWRVSRVGLLAGGVGATIFILAIPFSLPLLGPIAGLARAIPAIPIILGVAGLAGFLPGVISALWTREWGELVSLALPAMMIGLTLQNFLDPWMDARISMRSFATEVRRHVGSSDRVLFFEQTIPAVVLYSGLDIPTLFDPSQAGPDPFYLIVPDSLVEDLPKPWRTQGRVVAEGRGRVFASRVMGIRLLQLTGQGLR
jgi:4-amino-4-deoxy-L-arabinose transferase-like glycosyltransferase